MNPLIIPRHNDAELSRLSCWRKSTAWIHDGNVEPVLVPVERLIPWLISLEVVFPPGKCCIIWQWPPSTELSTVALAITPLPPGYMSYRVFYCMCMAPRLVIISKPNMLKWRHLQLPLLLLQILLRQVLPLVLWLLLLFVLLLLLSLLLLLLYFYLSVFALVIMRVAGRPLKNQYKLKINSG